MPLPGCGSQAYVVKVPSILQENCVQENGPKESFGREKAAMSEANDPKPIGPDGGEPAPRVLSPAAQRALAEAQARRAEIDARAADVASRKEIDGRGGLEPVRYNDWEVKGLTSDF
jgi:hypothetical protein